MKNSEVSNPLASPCIRNCCLDEHEICLGCFRSMNEIMQWTRVDEETRQKFLDNADVRRKQSGKLDKRYVAKDGE